MSTADSLYPAAGWHIRGEMGGVWTPPIKLVDGVWFRLADQWLGDPDGAAATRTTAGWGYTRTSFEKVDQVSVERTDFVPDGTRATLVGLTLTSPQPRTLPIAVDAHSELMSAYPWGWTTPNAGTFNLQDTGSYRTYDGRGVLQFREQGTPPVPNASAHDWAALVAGQSTPTIAPARPRPPWSPGPGRGLPRGRPGTVHLRRRRLRQGHGWPAALAGQTGAEQADHALVRRGRLGQGHHGRASGAEQGPGRPRRRAREQGRLAQGLGLAHPGRPPRRPAAGAEHRLEQAESGRLGPGGT